MKINMEEIKKSLTPKLINKEKVNFVYAGEIFSKLRDVRPFIEALNNIKGILFYIII